MTPVLNNKVLMKWMLWLYPILLIHLLEEKMFFQKIFMYGNSLVMMINTVLKNPLITLNIKAL